MRNTEELIDEALPQNQSEDFKTRNRKIVHAGIIGIIANVCLAVLKALVGTVTHSIAITLDALNNLTDAGASVITIAGTKLAAKKPDKKHPYGHGRIEYLSAMLLGTIVMSAGLSSFVESVKKIMNPAMPKYDSVSLIIVEVCILVKIALSKYSSRMGRMLNSETLVNSGKDAAMDVLISTTTLVAALIFVFFGISLESWLGAGISLLIIKTGLEMVLETLSELLGQRVDPGFSAEIRKTVTSFPEVHGVYDLMFHDYGPNRMTASLHIEVDDSMQAWEISDLIRRISQAVLQNNHVLLTAVGIYSMNTNDEKAIQLRREITELAMKHSHVLQVHGFYLKDNTVQFDVIVDFDTEDPSALCDEIIEEVREKHPGLNVRAFWDADYSFSE